MALVFRNPPLSPHFHLSEVISTNVKGGVAANHDALFDSTAYLFNAVALAQTLEHIRKYALDNTPIIVNSWFRCPMVNKSVGGVSNSLHLMGRAVDIRSDKFSPSEIYNILSEKYKHRLAELILYPSFVHLAINPVRYGKEIVLPQTY